jgi:hypothetical protein
MSAFSNRAYRKGCKKQQKKKKRKTFQLVKKGKENKKKVTK